MKTIMKVLIPGAFLFLFTDFGAREAEAAETYPLPAGCNNGGEKGGMLCWGTMRGFRVSPSDGAYAIIRTDYATSDGTPRRSFSARFNGVTYGCLITETFPAEALNQLMTNVDVHFSITAG